MLPVFFGKRVVAFVVHRVVGLHAFLVLGRVFLRHDSFRNAVDISPEHLEMLVFDDARVGLIVRGVVDNGASLIVRDVLSAGLETDRAPVELAELAAEIFVEGARIDELVGDLAPVALVFGKEVHARTGLDIGEQAVDELVVAADGDALVLVVEVVVVEHEAHREPLDDERRQILATAAPLFLGVFLDELLEDVLANKRERLFFQVCGLAALQRGDGICFLLFNFCLGFRRRRNAPHLIERVHVEGQVVKFAFVIRDRAVRVAVKFDDGIYEVPYLLVACMENVGAVFMDINALDIFAIDVSAQLYAFVNDEAFPARFVGTISKCRPE